MKPTDFEESEKHAQASAGDEVDALLRGFQSEGLDSVKGIIDDITELIQKREQLSQVIFQDLEKMKININAFLNSQGAEMGVREKIELKKKELEVEEEKIKEKLDSWKDIALLKRELRIHTADFSNKMTKMNLLDEMMR